MKRKQPRAQRPKRIPIASDVELGLAWYSREAWARLREVADDADALDDSYKAWERGAVQAIRGAATVGRHLHKVPIDIDSLISWCHERNRRIDSAARSEYVTYLLRRGEQGE